MALTQLVFGDTDSDLILIFSPAFII